MKKHNRQLDEDTEIVIRFHRLVTSRSPSLYSFRAQVKELEPRLYKILIDGLAAREMKKEREELYDRLAGMTG